ncbi:MAG: riboflavin synthase [Acidobacteriota bacterium]
MFTGLVHQRGRLTADPQPAGAEGSGARRLRLAHGADLSDRLEVGSSLAVDGVCLTLIEATSGASVVELSPETLARTELGHRRAGDEVNLEPALRSGDALGGHWVQGHVDGVLAVVEREDLGTHREIAFELPPDWAPYVVEKGSVTLDGVSLTVSRLADDRFWTALIPHTLEVTTLDRLEVGSRVHFEADILAKYVRRALDAAGRLA